MERPALTRRPVTRRTVLASLGGTAVAGAVAGPLEVAFGAPATGATAAPAPVLCVVRLPGGFDGLSAVAPIGDPDYARLRPTLAVPASAAKRVDATFGLHPALAPLYPLWDAGRLGAVHAVGQVSPQRSHFEAMAELDRADPRGGLRTGWLERCLAALPGTGPLTGTALGTASAPALWNGERTAVAARELGDLHLPIDAAVTPFARWQQAMGALHAGAAATVRAPMERALGAIDAVRVAVPAAGPGYPDTPYGHALRDVARLVKGRVGLRLASVTYPGWDIHQGHGGVDATAITSFATKLGELARGLAAFAADLGPDLDHVTVVTLSEFGRRVAENGNHGFDHGHGNGMLVLGGRVRGGRVHGHWPSLRASALERGDLAVTTDYRAVLAEALTRTGVDRPGDVFPGLPTARPGVVA